MTLPFELLEGEASHGLFGTRRQAQAHAELVAAKRGQRLRWCSSGPGDMLGTAEAAGTSPPVTFTVRRVGSTRHR